MIKTILDQDLYTFTVGQAVMEHFPDAWVSFEFINRKNISFNESFFRVLKNKISNMSQIPNISYTQKKKLGEMCPFLKPSYLEYLQNYEYDPEEVKLIKDGNHLKLRIEGPWHRTIFWEVPLLALICETYYETVDCNWSDSGQDELVLAKGKKLSAAGVVWADFGTRRRRNFASQERVVRLFKDLPGFVGTSNVQLAMDYNVKAIGTMSHQWIMGVSALDSLRYANRFALKRWNQTYKGDLGIVLPDTFGTSDFFEDIDKELARLFDGIRHDSQNPYTFTDKVVAHYNSLRIPTETKSIVYSDNLNVDSAIDISNYAKSKNIKSSCGIGTHLTNDFENSPPLNIVIKLRSVRKNVNSQEVFVVKLSDDPSKATGDIDAIKVALWTFFGEKL